MSLSIFCKSYLKINIYLILSYLTYSHSVTVPRFTCTCPCARSTWRCVSALAGLFLPALVQCTAVSLFLCGFSQLINASYPYNIEYCSNIASILLCHFHHFREHSLKVNKHVCNPAAIFVQDLATREKCYKFITDSILSFRFCNIPAISVQDFIT